MKRFVIPTLLLVVPFLGWTQQTVYKNGFGINQDFHDYNVRLLDNKITSFDSSLSQSLRISYNRYLGRSWSFAVGVTNGFLLNQTEENKLIRKSYLFGGDIDLMLTLNNGRFFPVESVIAPYLSFGYNFNYLSAYKDLNITPMVISNEYGFGANVRLGPKSKIQIGAALNQQLNGDFDTHVQYRLGFAQSIGKEQEIDRKPTKPLDYDNDGIADVDDNCPTLPGISANGGCPESWAESVGNKVLSDSMIAMIESLEQTIAGLQAEIEALSKNKVVRVQTDSSNGDTKDSKPVVTTSTTKQPDEQTDKKKDTSDQTNKDDSQGQKDVGETVQTSGDKSGKTDPTETSDTEPMVSYKSENDVSSYYVIAISTKDKSLAERSAAMIAKDYQIVKILPQPNGYYRVGIYATKTKSEALKILEYAKSHGIPSGWIAFE